MANIRLQDISAGSILATVLGSVALAACGGQSAGPDPAAPTAPGTDTPPANVLVEPAPGAAATVAAAPAPAAPVEPPVLMKDVGFKVPESVLYVADQDVYFVSNIDGKPTDADSNGFISKVSPEGKVLELKWIDGSKKASALNAPKGMGLKGKVLYVADLTFVRLFDSKTGAPLGKIAAPGATFLNDVAVAPDGTVYVSDSGLKMGKDGLEPNGTDAIYKIGKAGRADKLVANAELGRPNGLLADDQGVWVSTFGTGAIYRVGLDGKKEADIKIPGGQLDGLVKLSDGSVLVASWGGSTVLRGTPGGAFEPIVQNVKSPADIGYDSKRNVILIPMFQSDAVQLSKLPGAPPVPAAPAVAAAPAGAAPAAAKPGAAPAAAKPGNAPAAAPAAPKPATAAPAPAKPGPAAPAPAPAAAPKVAAPAPATTGAPVAPAMAPASKPTGAPVVPAKAAAPAPAAPPPPGAAPAAPPAGAGKK